MAAKIYAVFNAITQRAMKRECLLGLVLLLVPPTVCAIILETKCYQISLKLSCEINRKRYERLFIAFYEHKLFIIYPLNTLPNYERFGL